MFCNYINDSFSRICEGYENYYSVYSCKKGEGRGYIVHLRYRPFVTDCLMYNRHHEESQSVQIWWVDNFNTTVDSGGDTRGARGGGGHFSKYDEIMEHENILISDSTCDKVSWGHKNI